MSDPRHPKAVICTGGRVLYDDKRDIPDMQVITYEYDDFTMTCECGVFGDYMTKSKADVRLGDKFLMGSEIFMVS